MAFVKDTIRLANDDIQCFATSADIVYMEDGLTLEEMVKLLARLKDPAFNGNFTAGEGTTANTLNFAIGKYNLTPKPVTDLEGDLFIIGNGSQAIHSNAFRVSMEGETYSGAYHSAGADIAEYFEWDDGNPQNIDRRGRIVTLNEDKISLASEGDFLLGVVSAMPSFIGDAQEDMWAKTYLTDIFGQIIEKNGIRQVNPDHDNSVEYVPRSKRKEWSAISLKGKVVITDDGSCNVNGYCKALEDGVATCAQKKTNFRVMKRIDDTHIKVLQY